MWTPRVRSDRAKGGHQLGRQLAGSTHSGHKISVITSGWKVPVKEELPDGFKRPTTSQACGFVVSVVVVPLVAPYGANGRIGDLHALEARRSKDWC